MYREGKACIFVCEALLQFTSLPSLLKFITETWRKRIGKSSQKIKLFELDSLFNQATRFPVYPFFSKSSFFHQLASPLLFPCIQPDSSYEILTIKQSPKGPSSPLPSFFSPVLFPLVPSNHKYVAYNCESPHLHTICYRLSHKCFLQILQILFHQADLLLKNLK